MNQDKEMTFWDHLEELRSVIIKSLCLLLVLMVGTFFLKNFIFDRIILPPLNSDFVLYKFFDSLLGLVGDEKVSHFNIELVNIEMTSQFFIHLRVSFYVALVLAMPFILYQIWSFVKPGLYKEEQIKVKSAFAFAGGLFYLGVVVGYILVLPLTVRFLGTYQVSDAVPNQIALSSYIGMFISLIMIMGICFEMPVLAVLLSKFGLIDKQFLKKYRKHAFVILLALSAVITPSGDAVTMLFVTIPLYFLYELSIMVCKKKMLKRYDFYK